MFNLWDGYLESINDAFKNIFCKKDPNILLRRVYL